MYTEIESKGDFEKYGSDYSSINYENFNATNLVYNHDGYTVFKIENFNEISGFDKYSAICGSENFFNFYSKKGDLYFLFYKGDYKYSYSINKDTNILDVLSRPKNYTTCVTNLIHNDLETYKVITMATPFKLLA